jgi:hypothetical protein
MTGKSSPRVLPQSIRLFSFFAPLGILTIGCLVPAQAANILVVAGSDSTAQTAAAHLNTDLSGTNTVTVVNTGVPADLTPYTQIYDVRYNNNPALTGGEQAQYLAFLNAAPNNTLFLMGENTGFNARNGPIFQLVTLAGGGSIAVPAGNNLGAETVNPLFRTPNNISTISYAACGLVTSSGSGAFATSEAGGGCSIFFGLGALTNAPQGALVVVLDVNFIATAPTGAAVNEVAFRQNLEAFVSAPPVAPPPVAPAAGPSTVPALSELGVILLACGLIIVAARKLRAPGMTAP